MHLDGLLKKRGGKDIHGGIPKGGPRIFPGGNTQKSQDASGYTPFSGPERALRDARHNIDHYLVFGCLCRATPAAHLCYLGRRTGFPIRPPATLDKVDRMFAKLQRDIPRPLWQELHRQAWISPETWSLINTRIEVHQRNYQRSSRPSAAQSRLGSRETSSYGQQKWGQLWNPSSHPICLLFEKHGSGCGDSIRLQ